jgi:hypothetical protein
MLPLFFLLYKKKIVIGWGYENKNNGEQKMSGGELDYIYSRVEDAAWTLAKSQDQLHLAFAKHLFAVATALRETEWVLSCDSSPGSDHEAILAVITPQDVLASLVDNAEKTQAQLQEWIVRAKGESK